MKALGSVASGLAALSLMCGTAHAETDVLYGSFAPATSAFTKGFFEPWIEEVENLTDGSVKFQFIPGGGVVDMKTALGGVRDGVVDGAFYVTVSHASELPILYMLSELIGMGANNASRLGAFNQFVIQDCPECQAELKKWNEVFLGGYSLSDYYLFCTKSVQTEDDFDGLRCACNAALFAFVRGGR